jgi:hypothetical protein
MPYLIFGTWLLRTTNDFDLKNEFNYIKINEEPIVKLKSIHQDGFIGIKKSRVGIIEDIMPVSKNTYNFTLNYSTKNTYSYSLLGIEIPEYKTRSISYNKTKKLNINIFDRSLLIIDTELDLYYIFDLYVGDFKYPNVETNINTFVFTQVISILLSLLITILLK